MARAPVNAAIVLGVAGILALGFWQMKKGPAAPAAPVVVQQQSYLSAPPRNEQPLEEYTRFYKRRDFAVDGGAGKLGYYWFEPAGAPYPPGLKFPLVLILHGGSGKSYAGKYLISRQMQLDFPAFIVVPMVPFGMKWDLPAAFPDWPNKYTPPQRDQLGLPFAVDLVKDIAAKYPVDANRIYVLGCSEGGVGSLGAAADYSDIFAAGVPISGTWTAQEAAKLAKMPLWIMHGAQDPIMPPGIMRAVAAAVKKAGGTVSYTEFPDMGHECPSPGLYAKPMWQWLFSQKKAGINNAP